MQFDDITYEIKGIREYVGDTLHTIEYSSNEEYYTVRYVNGRKDREGYISESDISYQEYDDFEYSNLPAAITEFDIWLEAVMRFIEEHNAKFSSKSVTYEITDKRDNGMYDYVMKVDGAEAENGVAKYKDIPEESKDAWNDSVKKFHKENKIALPSDEIDKALSEIKNRISLPDRQFGEKKDLEIPGILNALKYLNSDPCRFLEELMTAVKKGPTGIKDIVPHNISVVKSNLDIDMRTASSGFNALVAPAAETLEKKVEEIVEQVKEIDTAQEEYRNEFADLITSVEEELADEELPEESEIIIKEYMHEIPDNIAKLGAELMKKRFNDYHISSTVKKRFDENFEKYFKAAFASNNVPKEMALLSIIESNVININTENSATAKGMWQIVRMAGKQYRLLQASVRQGVDPKKAGNKDYVITSDYDKRADVEASTNAAAKMMRDIRNNRAKIKNTNWLYVAAAYNWGGGSVSKAISKTLKEADGSVSIWKTWPQLPKETQNYVALLIALTRDMGWSTDTLFE